VRQQRQYDAALTNAESRLLPAHFEVSFGQANDPAAEPGDADAPGTERTAANGAETGDPLSTDRPFAFDCGAETVFLSGRIDRIDLGEAAGRPIFNIVDYKSGSSRKYGAKAVSEGHVLQLPLYLLAAAELLLADRQAAPLSAGYWFLKQAGFKEAVTCSEVSDGRLQPSSEWESFRAQLAERVLAAVHGIRAGYFPVASHDDQCTSTCAYRTVCRVNQVRALDKVWQPPAEATP
jgi:hypothetical protein